MPQTVKPCFPERESDWLTDTELDVYASEFQRTGFQGGLNWYPSSASAKSSNVLSLFANKKIEVPAWFIAGEADWGIHQAPGALDRMQSGACQDFRDLHLPSRCPGPD